MLYVTTRGTQDAFTAYRTARQDCGPDGGLFVPMQMPVLTQLEIRKLSQNSFGQNVADVLNLFFGTKITAWHVDVAISGCHIFTAKAVGHKTLMGQLWNDIHGDFYLVLRSLAALVSPESTGEEGICNWLEIGVRIAVIFAIFGELLAAGKISLEKGMDVAVSTGSFAMPMALWYARQMGLPIKTIICGCNENGIVWELLHRGVADTGAIAAKTTTPESDFAVPPNLERLVHAALGHDEARRYRRTCAEGKTYSLTEMDTSRLNTGMFAAVVSMDRVSNIIPSVYRTNRYILGPYGALAYGALSDYRARTGSVGPALVLAEKSPVCDEIPVTEYMRMSPEELKRLVLEG